MEISSGDTIQFITKVDKSSKDLPIQHVILKVTEVTDKYVRGVNALRSLDLDNVAKPFRSYKLSNIVRESVWKLIG